MIIKLLYFGYLWSYYAISNRPVKFGLRTQNYVLYPFNFSRLVLRLGKKYS